MAAIFIKHYPEYKSKELTRRDAVAALAAAGIGLGGIAVYTSDKWDQSSPDGKPIDDLDMSMLRAVAEVLYRTDVAIADDFLEAYVRGRWQNDTSYYEGMADGVTAFNEYAQEEYDTSFESLTVDERDALFRTLGLDDVRPDPKGTEEEKIRYYVVNDLLYALYTTRVGGELAGVENPPGHPGGLDAYQRGPEA